jgi:diaminohydroxyphosphoribosylaminopyrimidine deaminase/5-amino-6-(5-phosphoribosylamino)uracil reductase
LAAGLRRVIVGMVDPDPRVKGKGIAQLRAAGLEVEVGVEEAACRRLNEAFLAAQLRGRPLVVLKAAMTLDGRIADREGRSQWITGKEARTAGHALRDQCDGILVGAGTVRADDPALTARLPGARDPLAVVLDSHLAISARAQLLQSGRQTLICCAEDAPRRDLPVEVLRLPRGEDGLLSLGHLMPALVQRGLHSLLVEGGGRVHRSFLAAGLVDRLHLFVAPAVLGEGPSWVGAPGWGLQEAPRLRRVAHIERGTDTELILEP